MPNRKSPQERKEEHSVNTVRCIHIILHAALKQAMKNQRLTRNASEATTRPKGESAI
jgi:hypothetical protein